jgi:hypothetical protein
MAQSHKSLPKPTSRKTINKRNKLQMKNLEVLQKLSK